MSTDADSPSNRPPPTEFTLNEVGRMVYDMTIRLANDEKKIQANRFAHESFDRQQTSLNKSVEDHMTRLQFAVEDLGKKSPEGTVTVTASKPRGWSLPRSVLVKPVGFDADAWPKLKIEPPRFSGEGVNLWIKKVQEYYNHNFTSLADRLYLTEFLLDDAAAEWFGFWKSNSEGRGWEDFLLDIKRRFDPDLYEDYVGRLASLLQIGSLEDYLAEFEPLLRKVSNVGDSTLTSLFIAGLASSLKHELLTRRSSSLSDAIALAQQLSACRTTAAQPVQSSGRQQWPRRDQRAAATTTANGPKLIEGLITEEVFASAFFEEAGSSVMQQRAASQSTIPTPLLSEIRQPYREFPVVRASATQDVEVANSKQVINESMAEDIGASPILSLINVPSNGVALNDDVTLDISRNVVILHPRSVMQVFAPPDHHMASRPLPEDQPNPSSNFGDVIEAKVGANSTPSYGDYCMESHLQKQALLCVADRDLFRFKQPLTSDGRSIPPRNVVTYLDSSCSILLYLMGSYQERYGEGSRDTLPFGRDKGIHIFDPGAGAFESDVSRAGENSSSLQHRPQFQMILTPDSRISTNSFIQIISISVDITLSRGYTNGAHFCSVTVDMVLLRSEVCYAWVSTFIFCAYPNVECPSKSITESNGKFSDGWFKDYNEAAYLEYKCSFDPNTHGEDGEVGNAIVEGPMFSRQLRLIPILLKDVFIVRLYMHNQELEHRELQLENWHLISVDDHITVRLLSNALSFHYCSPKGDIKVFGNIYRQKLMITFYLRWAGFIVDTMALQDLMDPFMFTKVRAFVSPVYESPLQRFCTLRLEDKAIFMSGGVDRDLNIHSGSTNSQAAQLDELNPHSRQSCSNRGPTARYRRFTTAGPIIPMQPECRVEPIVARDVKRSRTTSHQI